MSNQEYVDAFDGVRDGYKKLHTMTLDKVEIVCRQSRGRYYFEL